MAASIEQFHKTNYLFILNFIITLLHTIRPTLGDDFQFNIEPSLNIFNKDQENSGKQPAAWNGMNSQSVIFEAVAGKLFNKSVSEIAKTYGIESKDSIDVQVNLPNSAHDWLVYSEKSRLIQGVPTNLNVGSISLFIIFKFKYNDVTVPVRIGVLRDESETSFIAESDMFDVCAINEPVTAMSVSLQCLPSEIDKLQRISIILKLSSFFPVDPSALVIHFFHDNFADDRVFLTGGNGYDVLNENKLTVSWTIGCSSENKFDEIELLETSTADGTLADYLEVPVLEWTVVNRVSTRSKRHRRAAQRSNSDELSGTKGQNAKTAATPIMRGEEVITLQGRGRTKVQLNLIRNTPMPMAPVMASKMMTHKLVQPMMSSVAFPSVPESTPTPNDPPMPLFDLPYLEPKTSRFFQFRIPQDTFYDREDGDARNLQLQVFDADSGTMVEESAAWPRFDTESQELYGVPPNNDKHENLNMLLTAKDKQGASHTTKFELNVNRADKPKALNHKYTFYVTENEEQDPDDIFLSKFGRKLAIALAKYENNPGTITILKTGYAKNNQRIVVWYDEQLNSDKLCYEDEFLKVGILMVGSNGNVGKNKPDETFASKFKPEFRLRTIKIEYSGPCIPPTTTEYPDTTESETEITTYTDAWDEFTEMPPSIIPPPFKTTTEVLATTDEIMETTPEPPPPPPIPPKLMVKQLSNYVAEVGKASVFKIPLNLFKDENEDEEDLELEVVGMDGNAVPMWMKFLPESREILVIPSTEDFNLMSVHNETYHSFKCGLVAHNKDGKTSDEITIQIYVMQNMKQSKEYNHEFQVTISNHNIKDFSVDKTWMLTKLIAEVFQDGSNTDYVFVHPLRAGSVIFSWHNATLGSRDDCPSDEIAKLSEKIFTSDSKFIESVYKKFANQGMEISGGSLQKKNACVFGNVAAPSTPANDETTAPSNDPEIGAAGGSGMIIIAVVVVCLVLLVIILLVKCKLSKSAKRKRKHEESLANANQDSSANQKIKKGVPIIFQDELTPNGTASTTDATPLMESVNQSPQYKNNNNDSHLLNDRLIESTPLNQSTLAGTPITGKRTPPPYHPR